MEILTKSLSLSTKGNCQIIDITKGIEALLEDTKLQEGNVTIFVPGATGGITTTEVEPGLMKDIPEFFEKIIPENKNYHHNDTWQDYNGHSHVRATLLGPSLVVPFIKGQLLLGTWQQIIFIDFDNRPRDRKLVVQLIGKV